MKKITYLSNFVRTLDKNPSGEYIWECTCVCGKVIRLSTSTKAKQESCGCVAHKKASERLKGNKLTATHGKSNSLEYYAWQEMRRRCTNANRPGAENYILRGITYTPEWDSFAQFYADMGQAPKDFSLDRIDNSKGYCKENCRWASRTIQNRNKRVYKNSKTGCKGVTQYAPSKYRVTLGNKHIGVFNSLEAAIEARKHAEIKYWFN
jgi:hypothetical protein